MNLKKYKIQQVCSNCKSTILQIKRKENKELKLYCNLCNYYEDLPKWLLTKLKDSFNNKKYYKKVL